MAKPTLSKAKDEQQSRNHIDDLHHREQARPPNRVPEIGQKK